MSLIVETVLNNSQTNSSSFSLKGIPAGGTTGQQLVKVSDDNYDVQWDTAVGSGDMLRSIYDPDNDGVIEYYDLGNKPILPNRLVYINSVSDFPTQDTTTITLESGYAYHISTPITTSKRFICEDGTSLTASTVFNLSMTYTGTDPMFTSDNASWRLNSITLNCPNSTAIDFSGDGISIWENVAIIECANLAIFNGNGVGNFCNLNWNNCTFYNITGQGLQFFGFINIFSYSKIYNITTSSSHIAVDMGTATFYGVEVRDFEGIGPAGSIALKGLPNSGNILTGSLATVESSGLGGSMMTALDGIDITDIRWDFIGNAKVEDTMSDALAHFRNNSTNTVITASSTDGTNAVKINAIWSSGRFSKFSFDSSGRITYLAEKKITVPVDVSLHLISVGGGSITATAYIRKYTASSNSSAIVVETGVSTDLSGTTSKNISLPWQITFEEGDWIEVWVENNSNSNDILVKQGIIRIK